MLLNDVKIVQKHHKGSNNGGKIIFSRNEGSSVWEHQKMKDETRMISRFLSWVVGLNANDTFEMTNKRGKSVNECSDHRLGIY